MPAKVALCAQEDVVANPRILGLEDEALDSQQWLLLLTDAVKARQQLRECSQVEEVWVAHCADVEPINLAACAKADGKDRTVYLVASDAGGSLRSRVQQAGIDGILDGAGLAQRYGARKSESLAASRVPKADEPASQEGPSQPVEAGDEKPQEAAAADEGGRLRPEGPSQAAPAAQTGDSAAAAQAAGAPLAADTLVTAQHRAFLLPVLSGGGGAGKSTVAALSAALLQRAGMRTLVMDLDLQFGDMAAMLGISEPLGIDDLVRDPARVPQLVARDGKPALLAAPQRLEDAERLAGRIGHLIALLESRFDVIVVNTGSFWTEVHALLLERSDKALFLVDQRPSSLRACQRALDLCARCGIAASPFVFASNRCSKNALYTSIDISCAMSGAPAVELADGGVEVEEHLCDGLFADLLEKGNALCTSLDGVLGDLVPGYREAADSLGRQRRKGGFWHAVGRKRKGGDKRVAQ